WSPSVSVACERSTAIVACCTSTFGFHPTSVPSSVAKRNLLGPEMPPLETTNPSGVGLNVVPVGAPTAPGPADGGAGIATDGWFGATSLRLPWPSYRVVTPVALSDTQIGRPGPVDVPHGLCRLGSVWAAKPGMSETRC